MKLREGNPGKRKLNDDAPKPPQVACLEPPTYLGRYGKEEWRRIATELQSQDLLTSWDWSAFATYCEAYDTWRKAQNHIRRNGWVMVTPKGYEQQSPWVAILQKARKDIVTIGGLLGLNPADRGRLSLKGASPDGMSEADRFFANG